MTEKETLESMQILFGKNVVCTHGLYHIYNSDHSEVYIKHLDKEIDKRCKYSTLVVTDYVVIARTLNTKSVKYVILKKGTLDCIYKTQGRIIYIDENLVYDVYGNKANIISHTGRTLLTLSNIQSIEVLDNKRYLVKSQNSFSDTILIYRPQLDLILSVAKDRRYLIYKSKEHKDAVEVVSMQGGKYIYKFKTNECINTFTNKAENIQLFDLMG